MAIKLYLNFFKLAIFAMSQLSKPDYLDSLNQNVSHGLSRFVWGVCLSNLCLCITLVAIDCLLLLCILG